MGRMHPRNERGEVARSASGPAGDHQHGLPTTGAAPRLYQRLLERLSAQIADGSLVPGTPLLESQIAARFGTSRAPARQALAHLAEAGAVRREGRLGYVVIGERAEGAAPPEAPPAHEPIERLAAASTWQRIYGEVERDIAARTSFASWRVNESELARTYRVSRTVARDVLARLQQRGVIKKDSHSRWHAPALTPSYVGELYQMRWLLEPAALTEAARSVPSELVEAIHGNLTAALANADRLEGSDLDVLERELHVDLLAFCGNRTLMEAIGLCQSLLIAHTFLYSWRPRLFDAEPFLPEHLAVIKRLRAGKVAEAAEALERHLKVSRDRAVERIARVVQEVDPEPLPYLSRYEAAGEHFD